MRSATFERVWPDTRPGSSLQNFVLGTSTRNVKERVFGCSGAVLLRREDVNLSDVTSINNSTIKVWSENAHALLSCPELRKEFVSQGGVPRLLHRIWECDTIPEQYFPALLSWLKNAPGVFNVLWTRETREAFILRELGPKRLELYNRLAPGAFRADLFRYFVLFYIGGIYSDVDVFLELNLRVIMDFTAGPTIAIDLQRNKLLNGAIVMSPPQHLLFTCAMGEVFDHSDRRVYEGDGLDVSGPGVLGECVRHILGFDVLQFTPGMIGVGLVQLRLLHSLWIDGIHVVQFGNASNLLRLSPGGVGYSRAVESKCDPGEHYSILFERREVYRINTTP